MHTDWKTFERNRRPVGYDHHVVSKKLIVDCEKSKSTNLNPYIINWIISFLGNCKKRVVMDGKITDYVDINKGVPQGTVLGPLLFSLIVNDIKLVDSNNQISKCADDFYTCQLFLRYKREIFILEVLGFLQTTQSFPKIPKEVRSLPKTSEFCRRRSYRENAYPQNQRSLGRYCYYFIHLHMVFVPYMGLS